MKIKEYDQDLIRKLHRAQLENLICFAQICERHKLDWFLCYGSLIGAVRHGGFIPWDDDFDVAMLRPDYEKFIELSHLEINEGFEVLSVKYEKTYQRPFARVQLKGTTYIEPSMEGADTKEGIYIDVFVFDRVPAEEDKALNFMKKTAFWQILFGAMMIEKPQIAETGDEIEARKRKQWRFIHQFGKITHFPKRLLFKVFERKAQKYRDTYTGYVTCIKGSSTAIQQEKWCEDTIPWFFEGIKVRIPKEYDAMLTHIYGNYREMCRYNHNPTFMDFGLWEEKLDCKWQADRFNSMDSDYEKVIEAATNSDSSEKYVLFHFTSLGFLLDADKMFDRLEEALSLFCSHQNLKVIFSPTLSLEYELRDISDTIYDRYKRIHEFVTESSCFYVPIDELRMSKQAEVLSELVDAYYGDYTGITEELVKQNKPVMVAKYV